MLSDIPFDFKRFKIKSTTLKKKTLKKGNNNFRTFGTHVQKLI